jgi:hypothetical protein
MGGLGGIKKAGPDDPCRFVSDKLMKNYHFPKLVILSAAKNLAFSYS